MLRSGEEKDTGIFHEQICTAPTDACLTPPMPLVGPASLQMDQREPARQEDGTTESGAKTHIWIAVSGYVLVANIKKRLKLEAGLYTILQIFSVTIC